jgi:hypothetical protein
MDGLYFLPRVGKFGGVISKFWYIGSYIAKPWINHGGEVSFPLDLIYNQQRTTNKNEWTLKQNNAQAKLITTLD